MDQSAYIGAERIEVVEHVLVRMFRSVLQRLGDAEPPQIKEVSLRLDRGETRVVIRAAFEKPDGRDWNTEHHVSAHEFRSSTLDDIRSARFVYDAGAIWSRCYEDHYVGRVVEAGHRQMREAARVVGPENWHLLDEQRQALELYGRSVSLNHDVMMAPSRHQTATEVSMRRQQYEGMFRISDDEHGPSPAVAEYLAECSRRVQREIDRQIMSSIQGIDASAVWVEESGSIDLPAMMEAASAAMARNPYHRDWQAALRRPTEYGVDPAQPGSDWSAVQYRFGQAILRHSPGLLFFPGSELEVGTPEVQAKALTLLRENLTPEQLAQYEAKRHFDVKGGETGRTYRIHHGRQMNIHELDGRGAKACGWCFLPQGELPAGDIMLAQKTALELYELDALKIANRF